MLDAALIVNLIGNLSSKNLAQMLNPYSISQVLLNKTNFLQYIEAFAIIVSFKPVSYTLHTLI